MTEHLDKGAGSCNDDAMTDQYAPFLPEDFDPTDSDMVSTLVARCNPQIDRQHDMLELLLQHHALLDLHGLQHTAAHETCIRMIRHFDDAMDKSLMAMWS